MKIIEPAPTGKNPPEYVTGEGAVAQCERGAL